MASLNISKFWICISFVSYFLLCFLNNGNALALGGEDSLYVTVQTTSLFPSSVCTPTPGPNKRSSSLKLVHRHGPCSSNKDTNSPSMSQILAQDRIRASLIQSQITFPSKTTSKETDSKLAVPINSGESLGTYNYVVKVGLGTPKKDLSLIFDTGSDITWTQCKPCPNCYKQKETMFDPVGSKTYSNIMCNSDLCGLLHSATGYDSECESSTPCTYRQIYNDESSSGGFLAKETLTTSTDVFKDFIFGCSNNNANSNPSETAGILGLGREQLSFVSQTAHKYGKYFSHCFPSKSSSIGYVTFGKQEASSSVKFTPFSDHSPTNTKHYFVDLMAIYVAGTKISINSNEYSSSGVTAIDSGTVITRLPPKTYEMLRGNFKRRMMKYPTAGIDHDLDTCYNLSKYTSVTLPNISFLFNGGVMVDLHPSGILIGDHPSKMCLAFIGDKFPILGNYQQKTLEVVYDVQGGKIGFGKGGCA